MTLTSDLPQLRTFVAYLNNFLYTRIVEIESSGSRGMSHVDTPDVQTVDFSFTSFSNATKINTNSRIVEGVPS